MPYKRLRRVAVAALCGAALAGGGEARADELQDSVDRATTLAMSERYKEALAELQAAYAVRQSPRLLYMMAKMQQRLGDAAAALASYERFLAADTEGDPRYLADADAQVARLRQVLGRPQLPLRPGGPAGPAPGAGPAEASPEGVHFKMKPSAGLIAGGAVLFGAAFVGAVVTGAIFLEPGSGMCGGSNNLLVFNGSASSCSIGNSQVAAGTLLIPVTGPFVAAFAYRDPVWSINWALVDGVAQVGGLTMMIYAATHPNKVPVIGESFLVLPRCRLHRRRPRQATRSAASALATRDAVWARLLRSPAARARFARGTGRWW
jgi:hypothetical protein